MGYPPPALGQVQFPIMQHMKHTSLLRTVAWAASALVMSGHMHAHAQVSGVAASAPSTTTTCSGVLNHQFPRLQDDAPQNLCQYSGKVVLVVNTASYCGFTSQYEGLEALYAKYQKQGLVVLGFPSNDFGKQEPGSSKEIADFCFNTYGVKFPMFAKSEVSGDKRNALYADLYQALKAEPKWNFHKFLIDRNGKPVDSFNSLTKPDSSKLVSAIEKALSSKG